MKRFRLTVQASVGMVFGLALCWVLVHQAGMTEAQARQLFENINWPALLGVMVITWLMLEAGARKWSYLDHAMDGQTPRPHAYYMRHFTWQSWLAQILPSTAAIIAGRALVTHVADEHNWKRGFKNALLDQLSELFVILAFIPATLWQLHSGASFGAWLSAGLIATLAAGFLGMKLLPRFFLRDALLWSFVRMALVTMRLILGAMAFTFAVQPLHIAFAMPLATLTALLPLTPGNLGLYEWGWTYALSLWHEPIAIAALYMLSYRVLILIAQTLMLPLIFWKRGR